MEEKILDQIVDKNSLEPSFDLHDICNALGIELKEGEEISIETLEELTNGGGDEEDGRE